MNVFPIAPAASRYLWFLVPVLAILVGAATLLVLSVRGSRAATFEIRPDGLALHGLPLVAQLRWRGGAQDVRGAADRAPLDALELVRGLKRPRALAAKDPLQDLPRGAPGKLADEGDLARSLVGRHAGAAVALDVGDGDPGVRLGDDEGAHHLPTERLHQQPAPD